VRPGPDWSVPPTGWGARVDYDQWNDPYTPDDGIALHHGGSSDYPAHRKPYSQDKEMAQLRGWEAFHIDGRGWRGIAYGWGLGQSGTLYRLRGWNTYGAHLGDVDGDGIANNAEILPVVFIGSGSRVSLSPAAEATLVRFRRYAETVAPEATRLYGHKEIQAKPTACPGQLLMDYVTTHRELEDDMSVSSWAQSSWDWAKARFSWTSGPKDVVTVEQLMVFLKRYDDSRPAEGHDHDGTYVKNVIVSK
jgi:hypothetical protein